MREGEAAALQAGPPCESWSNARTLDTQCCGHAVPPGGVCPTCRRPTPRPLRTHRHYWGRPGLCKREQQQVRLGGALLRVSGTLLYDCEQFEAPALLEHPAPQPNLLAPSIFRLKELHQLTTLPTAKLHTIHQCAFGAHSIKPTSILALNAPTTEQHLRQHGNNGYCPHPPGTHRTLQGRNSDGEWSTAPAKEYPAALCATFARVILQSIGKWTHLQTDGNTDFTDRLSHFYVPLDPYHQTRRTHDVYRSDWLT